mgnify:CR=1 FL=1
MYWRIIRTNEDGSLRLLYSGISPDTAEGYIGASAFNPSYNDPMYIGYMYGTSDSLESNRTNINDSTIKIYVDTWYQNNLLNNYDKYISKAAIYCNDRSISSDYTYSVSDNFGHGPDTRLKNYTPTYKCGGNGTGGLFESAQAVADKFSASLDAGGNGQLTYPIALMTADEVAFAGGKRSTDLSSPYAWYYTNSQGESIIGEHSWWTLSPLGWFASHERMVDINSIMHGHLGSESVQYDHGVRPSTSLAPCVDIKSGNGTPESPYEIDYESSCK